MKKLKLILITSLIVLTVAWVSYGVVYSRYREVNVVALDQCYGQITTEITTVEVDEACSKIVEEAHKSSDAHLLAILSWVASGAVLVAGITGSVLIFKVISRKRNSNNKKGRPNSRRI